MAQGTYVANSLADYLNRHPEMEQKLTKAAHAAISPLKAKNASAKQPASSYTKTSMSIM